MGGSWSNTVPQSEPLIVRSYRCIPPIERFLVDRFAEQYDTFSPFVPAVTVDGHFLLNVPTWWQIRRDAFVAMYNLQRVEFEFEGIPLDVYLANRLWMLQVRNALNAGIISSSDDFCYQRDFVNSP